MNSVPDRPFATRTDTELDNAIRLNLSQQESVAKQHTSAAKAILAQLKSRCAELIAERNARQDMQTIPF